MIRIQFALYTTSPRERQEPSKNQLINTRINVIKNIIVE